MEKNKPPKLLYRDGSPMRTHKSKIIEELMNEDKQQTAVEWFQEQIIKIVNGKCELSEIQIFQQAKQMEQKQHETTFHRGINIGALNPELDCEGRNQSAKHYYETTFKKLNF
jgi:hypothetical protein